MKKRIALGMTLIFMMLVLARISNAQDNHSDMYEIWNLAALYKLENVAEVDYSFDNDPKMYEIWDLRGEDLRYFLDFTESLNIARSETFGPSINKDIPMTLAREQEIVAGISDDVFGKNDVGQGGSIELSGLEVKYADKLQSILGAILTGNGDQYFTPEYLEYRVAIVQYVDETDAKIFSPSTDEDIDNFSRYLDKNLQGYASGQTDPVLMSSGSCITRTNNNWPTKLWVTPSNSGSSWYYANNPGKPDCDIYVKYYTGGSTWSHLHATTSDGACVLGKFSGFAAYMSGNFNHVQYGKNRVTWWWPLGCNTTAYAVMVGTRLGP